MSTPYPRRVPHRWLILLTDLVVLAWALALVHLTGGGPPYPVTAAVFACWWLVLARLELGRVGPLPSRVEVGRVLNASAQVCVVAVVVVSLLRVEWARPYLLVGLPVGCLALLASRTLWCHWLRTERVLGAQRARTVVVGEEDHATVLCEEIERSPDPVYVVVGRLALDREPRQGQDVVAEIIDVVRRRQADAVLVTACPTLDFETARRLRWELEGTGVHLAVVPPISAVTMSRLRSTTVAGLPMLSVAEPRFSGPARVTKRLVDVLASAVLLTLFSPLLAVIAVAVRRDGGPALYRQQRIGRAGRPFAMVKFRSMIAGADRLRDVLAHRNDADGLLFKLFDDPRVTTVGRFLRRWSLDELPQLWNVLVGDMSLVGPRPPLADEVLGYTRLLHRRLLVKPGMTGLWQVGGRSNLSWEEGLRLDFYYVENWSLLLDATILFRTARAVLDGDGAY
ncbi:sugar transferase [Actinosynnema sp. NPDC020468]|uniref:sugar transferase n=1 Tax=Actinosynnema sp. NPDC020468 TaxID=3154488 RepID=UPI0033F4DB49